MLGDQDLSQISRTVMFIPDEGSPIEVVTGIVITFTTFVAA